MVKTTDETRRYWDQQAARYDRTPAWLERLLIGNARQWIARRAQGRTLEVAAGTGRNLPYYGDGVRLTAVDLSPGMLARARERAEERGRDVEFREADAAHLPFPDESFDTVVCTLSICAVPDRDAAVDEMIRVLRPGGRLLLVDHVERRWRRGRPVTLAVARGLAVESRPRMRLGLIDLAALRKPQS